MKHFLILTFQFWLVLSAFQARAAVGIVVYESKGVDARRTSSGHIALIATTLCANGIDQVRACGDGDEPGVVVTRYANLAYGYDRSVFVAPIRDHFMATSDERMIPALSSGGTLEAMQIEYWRTHLRPYLPPFSQARYQELRDEMERFDAGRTFRRLISLELLIGALSPTKKKYPTEPIAIIEPTTNEMIPNGRWREAIGAAHMRTSMILTAPATPEQEGRLIGFVEKSKKQPFQALSDNCSDLVERALVEVFGDTGLQFRSREAKIADGWVTSPLSVATDFLRYAQRERIAISVQPVPMLSGTRRPTARVTSLSRGSLVPNATQGKLAFSMKIYFNTLNPLLGLTAFTVDKLSRFSDLQKLVHERGSADLSRLAYSVRTTKSASPDEIQAWRREQVRVFGTTACWKAKRDQFGALVAQAREVGLLTGAERSMALRAGRPYLLPRLYERAAAAQSHAGALVLGMQNRVLEPVGTVTNFAGAQDSLPNGVSPLTLAFVPGREAIREMANGNDRGQQVVAFKIMTSVINYDLSSEQPHRRSTDQFSPDWNLFLDVARKNGLRMPLDGPAVESAADCSCREWDQGKATHDAWADDKGVWHTITRDTRDTLFGASR